MVYHTSGMKQHYRQPVFGNGYIQLFDFLDKITLLHIYASIKLISVIYNAEFSNVKLSRLVIITC